MIDDFCIKNMKTINKKERSVHRDAIIFLKIYILFPGYKNSS